MFKHIIVGVDGGDGGRDALALAAVLRGGEGEVTLAHVVCPAVVPWGERSAFPEAISREDAMRLLEAAREAFPAAADLCLRDAADPGRGLHELGEELNADLIVIGSSRRGFLGRVTMGDDTRRTLDGSPCAVAIAPVGYVRDPGRLARIGVGYNASIESEHALGVARRLAAEREATLVACEVIYLPARLWVGMMWPEQATLDDILEESRARLAQIEGVEPRALSGQPAEELARLSDELDLLVLGSRSYGPWDRLIYGSTARELARLARCPLLVLTRGARESQRDEPVHLEPERTAAA